MKNTVISRDDVERLENQADLWRLHAELAADICDTAKDGKYGLRITLIDKQYGANDGAADPHLSPEELGKLAEIFRSAAKRHEADRDRLLALLAMPAEVAGFALMPKS